MASFTFVNSKAQPEDFAQWEIIPGTDRAVLRPQKAGDVNHVLLVDANESMAPHWDDLSADCAQLGDAMINGDSNGIDLFFAGVNSGEDGDDDSAAGGFLDIADPRYIQEAFQLIKDAGLVKAEGVPSDLVKIVEQFLKNYKATPDEKKGEIKPQVITVWTDGTFDLDAFEEVLVKIGNDLKEANVPETLFGTQLYQVGDNNEVSEKFGYFDDELKAARGLDRDFIDHHPYVAKSATIESINKVLYGAIVKTLDNA